MPEAIPDLDARVRGIVSRWGHDPTGLVQVLREVQEEFGHLPRPALSLIAHFLRIPYSRVTGVASFYCSSPSSRTASTACCSPTTSRTAWRAASACSRRCATGCGSSPARSPRTDWSAWTALRRSACATTPANALRGFDDDPYKNVLLRVSQDVGPAFRVGAFGYLGKERPEEIVNSVWMAGGDATLSVKPFELNLQYVERRDSNPAFATIVPLEKVGTRGAFAELVYLPKGDASRWYGAGLFNWVDSDQEDLRYTAATAHVGYLLRRNIRITAEATYAFRGPRRTT